MLVNASPIFMEHCLQENTYQDIFPKETSCVYCKCSARPILLIDDEEGIIASFSPARDNKGIPIHPHDSVAFALYMCSECGEITTLWNQA